VCWLLVPAEIRMVPEFSSTINFFQRKTYLGFIMWRIRNTTPSRMHNAPTVIYATPKNGFRPPMILIVEITILLVPPKLVTSNATPN
jgi:hypothetical protein